MTSYVQITVQRGGEQHDIEASPDMPLHILFEAVSAAYGWHLDSAGQPITYAYQHQPGGQRLDPAQTLAEARVWPGALIVWLPQAQPAPAPLVKKPGRTAPLNHPTAPPPDYGPVSGWRRIDGLDEPARQAKKEEDDDDNQPNFRWKKLD